MRQRIFERWTDHRHITIEIGDRWTPARKNELNGYLNWWTGRQENPETIEEFRTHLQERLVASSPDRPAHAEIAFENIAIHDIANELLSYLDGLTATSTAP